MLFFNLFTNPLQFVAFALAILIAITIHEYAHAWTANYYGDATAKLQGRLTLNPIAHLDLMGTIFLLIAGFGWGKPVIINPANFRNPKLDSLTVSLAGPMSNLFLAVILGLLYRFILLPAILEPVILILILINLTLMIFNLIPIPPLDGSKILALFMSEQTYFLLQQYGVTLLLVILIISSFVPAISHFIFQTVAFFFSLITGKSILL